MPTQQDEDGRIFSTISPRRWYRNGPAAFLLDQDSMEIRDVKLVLIT